LQFFDHPALRADTERLTRSLGLTGIYNFDMIADAELTRFHWLECNPRVFHTMEAMALAGLNLLALALDRPEAAADRAEAAMARLRGTWLAGPLAAVLGLARARPLNAPTRRLLVHHLSDPLAFARERVGRAARRAWPDGSGSAGVARN
jgi:predicted ATP-grasp superfamily ATP-dependent carboligase